MHTKTTPRYRATALALALASLLWVSCALADPPARVARLGFAEGDVSLSPAGTSDWVQASLNRPLTTGDHLWTDSNARAELQLGGSAIRLGARSNLTLLNLDDSIAQLQLSEGSLRLRVRSMASRQRVEVDTPNLALVLTQAGDYRVDVDPDGNATSVRVLRGAAEAYGEGASYRISAGQAYRFYGTGLADLESLAAAPDDALDRWALQREQRIDGSTSARYVSSEVVGYEDLDADGSWRVDASYGNVWTPNRVANGWTPYRDGHWAWVDPWGWTWVDDAPWGYAVSHYGRWARIREAWSWVPGPQREAAVYAPALVVFLGGNNFRASVATGGSMGNVGWFPLAPREVYQPTYPVSRGYFERVNHSNAVIAPSTITTVYNQVNNTKVTTTNTTNVVNVTQVVYANQQVKGAVVAVPAQAFVQSKPVAKAVVPVTRELVLSAPVAALAMAAPPAQSAHGGAPDAHSKPPQERHAVVARTAPPVAQAPAAAPASVAPAAQAPRVHLLEPATAVIPPAVPAMAIGTGRSPAPRTPAAAKEEAARLEAAKPGSVKLEAAPAKVEVPAPAPTAKANTMPAQPDRAEAASKAAQQAETAQAQAARADAAKAEANHTAAVQERAAKAQAHRENAAKAGPAEAAPNHPAAAPNEPVHRPKTERELQLDEELRRAAEAAKKH